MVTPYITPHGIGCFAFNPFFSDPCCTFELTNFTSESGGEKSTRFFLCVSENRENLLVKGIKHPKPYICIYIYMELDYGEPRFVFCRIRLDMSYPANRKGAGRGTLHFFVGKRNTSMNQSTSYSNSPSNCSFCASLNVEKRTNQQRGSM